MQTDGQLYEVLHRGQNEFAPPSGPPRRGGLTDGIGRDELLIMAVMLLLLRGGRDADVPLLLALAYVLLG